VLQEVFAAYEAACADEHAQFNEPRPYREYIEWVHGLEHERSRPYWQRTLAGFKAPTPLVIARERDGETLGGNAWGSCGTRLSPSLSAELRALAREASVTVNTLLQGAWALLLHRYSGERDVVFGATRACRRSALGGADDMIGMFINTLPLRVAIDPERRLRDWLRDLREQQVALRDCEHTPLVKVQGWSEVPRGTPLFDTILVYENQTLDSRLRALGGRWSDRRFAVTGQANVPLVLNAWGDEAIVFQLDYSRRRFADAAIARMRGHLETLLEGMVAGPDARLKALSLLTVSERRAFPGEPARSYPAGGCLHERFEEQARQTPHEIAVQCEDRRLTYDELNRRANRVAHRLRQLGVRPDDLVGLRVERSLEMVIGILGILKSGAAYLPLDPAYPEERVAFMLEDSKVSVLATQQSLASGLATLTRHRVFLDVDSAGDDSNPVPRARPDSLAYVIYTSGSTGQPKGVMITHYNVTRLFEATREWYRFDRRDVWTLFHSYAFDFSVWELWGALLHGGRLVVVPYWVSRSPSAFRALLLAEQVTVLNQTPSAFRQLIQADAQEPKARYALRYVIFGGEALELSMLRPWFERHGDGELQLVNMYGITETTVHVTFRPISRADAESASGSVIGVPIPDLTLHLLDAYGEPVPVGVPGEMHVGGAGVARGYLNRPELNAARFIPDRFSGRDGARLYRSGDLARRLENGDIEFLGRIDHQVKIRGFRIELGEIEAAIARHPAIRGVAVLAREDQPGDKRLVAYFVAEQPAADLVDQLREALRRAMPEYMVPAHFIALDELPLTENGKVDRKALPAPDTTRVSRSVLVEPRTPAEKALASIWSSVLGVTPLGIRDNFFELGGDSILTIQVVARAREAGLAITPRQLFRHPTIEGLAPLASAGASAGAEQALLAGPVALTPIQHWFFEHDFAEPHHWNQAFLFEIDAALDRERLERAFAALLRHHDALRLRFERHANGWSQAYEAPASRVPLEWIAFDAVPDDSLGNAIAAAVAALQSTLSLSGPVVRLAHIGCGTHRTARLALIVHHLVVDGVSWRILVEDLMRAYRDAAHGAAPALPAKTSSYRRWSERLIELAGSPEAANERAYWRSVLQGPIACLPTDFDHAGPNNEDSLETLSVRLDAAATRSLLQQVPRAYGTQVNDALLAALAVSCADWSGDLPVLVALEGHGREDIGGDLDLTRTVGWFTSIYPVKLPVAAGAPLSDILRATKEMLRQVPRKGVGYGVLRYLTAEGLPSPTGTPGILFNYFGQFDQVVAGIPELRFARERCGPWRSPRAQRTHALQVTAIVAHGALEVRWHYSRNLHRRETIEAMANRYAAALRDLVAHCLGVAKRRYTPSDFPLARLGQEGLDRVAAEVDGIEDLYPLAPMQRLFYSMEAAGSRLGFEQWHFVLQGRVDAAALRRAWQRVLARHPVLRTSIYANALAEPLQIVHERVTLPWTEEDWRALSSEAQDARLQSLLSDERRHGFDLSAPPLTRITLIRTGDTTYHLLWGAHHLQVDGWSWPLIFRDLDALYRAEAHGSAADLPAASPYRAYIAWMDGEPFRRSEAFWRSALQGITAPTGLAFRVRPAVDGSDVNASAACVATLSRADSEAVQRFARTQRMTLSTLVQAAWALVLGHLCLRDDVIFGAAYSGRPTDIPGIEAMVGPCVNNVPVRVRIEYEKTLGEWLAALHRMQSEISEHQYAPLPMIQSWSAVPARFRLFDSLIVFQNYDGGDASRALGEVVVHTVSSPDATGYPFTLIVRPGPELRMKLIYRQRAADHQTMTGVLNALAALIAAMPDPAVQRPADLGQRLPENLKGATADAPCNADRARLPYTAPASEMERRVAGIWQELFEVDDISLEENFFDLGGHSLLLVRAHQRLRESLRPDLSIVALLRYPTIRALARHLENVDERPRGRDAILERARRQRGVQARRGDALRH
jgi:amino acid adenylation domain-containing protein/non-ribosomal peptide synthase protein (TIGR01720 family)